MVQVRANVVPYNIKAAGKYAALLTTMSLAGHLSSSNNGLWRIAAEDTMEPVAITGDTGTYAPDPGVSGTTLHKFAAFDSVDIVTRANTKTVANSSIAVSW